MSETKGIALTALDDVIALLHRQASGQPSAAPAAASPPPPRPMPARLAVATETYLTRRRMRSLPSFIERPPFDAAGRVALHDGFRIAIKHDGKPMPAPGAGATLDGVSLLFHPVCILQFRRTDGDTFCYFVDAGFAYLGAGPAELDGAAQAAIRPRLAMIATFLNGLGKATMPCRIPMDVRSFLRLSQATRQALLNHFGHVLKDPSDRPEANESDRFALDVVLDPEDGRHTVDPGRNHELRLGGAPVSLVPGWRIEALSSVFFPLFVASLGNGKGSASCWYFDCHGNFLADDWTRLPDWAAAILDVHSHVVLDDLWQDFVCNPVAGITDQAAAFLALAPLLRYAVFMRRLSVPQAAGATSIWNLETDALAPALAYVARTARGTALLDRAHVEHGLARDMQAQNVKLANTGSISWPSPIDGAELPTDGFALMLDDQFWCIRVHDPQSGLTFYVVGDGGHFRTFGLYLPQSDLLIVRNGAMLDAIRRYDNLRVHLLWHVIGFGGALLAGAEKPAGALSHVLRGRAAMQIGHFIWQDLSGIHGFLSAVRPERIPRFLVIDSALKPEIYGPLEELFPSLQGKIVRLEADFTQLTSLIYAENQRLFKATSMNIPDSIGRTILSRYRNLPEHADLLQRCAALRSNAGLVVVLGLRVGNRTLVDMEDFALKLLGVIYDAIPDAAVIVDGQNWSPDAIYESFGDNPLAPDSYLQQERAIVRQLEAYARWRGGRLIDNIGRPIGESLLWCDAADVFVAPWGAALAKYRWVCNKPGFVVTGRWNLLNRRDLGIYHDRPINEHPTELRLIDPALVEDIVDPAETEYSRVEKSNFRIVDFEPVKQEVAALLRKYAALREAVAPSERNPLA